MLRRVLRYDRQHGGRCHGLGQRIAPTNASRPARCACSHRVIVIDVARSPRFRRPPKRMTCARTVPAANYETPNLSQRDTLSAQTHDRPISLSTCDFNRDRANCRCCENDRGSPAWPRSSWIARRSRPLGQPTASGFVSPIMPMQVDLNELVAVHASTRPGANRFDAGWHDTSEILIAACRSGTAGVGDEVSVRRRR